MVWKVKDVKEEDGSEVAERQASNSPRGHQAARIAAPTRPVPNFVSSKAWTDRANAPHHTPSYRPHTILTETLPGT